MGLDSERMSLKVLIDSMETMSERGMQVGEYGLLNKVSFLVYLIDYIFWMLYDCFDRAVFFCVIVDDAGEGLFVVGKFLFG